LSALAWIATCTVLVGALLIAEWREARLGIWLAKPLAACCYIGLALQQGALDSSYGVWVLAALLGSWWGDVLLIPRNAPGVFRAGVLCFLLGHLGFVVAFCTRGLSIGASALAAPLVGVAAVLILRWLNPKVSDDMRIPVQIYIAVISLMLTLAIGTVSHLWSAYLLLGAAMFCVSDLAVARDRFVSPGFWNGAWGLPLYFGGQLLLAASVAA
jgi:uncharacterized membrane protein YhhN